MNECVSFVEVGNALQRCLGVNPPLLVPGQGREMCADASRLAEVYGVMLFEKQQVTPLASLTEAQRAAFQRWCVEQPGRAGGD